LAKFEGFQLFPQFTGCGDFFGVVFIGKGFLPDDLAEGLGDFAGVGFVSEDSGIEAKNREILQLETNIYRLSF